MAQPVDADERIRRMFDATTGEMAHQPANSVDDVYTRFRALRESGSVQRGSVQENFGFPGAHGVVSLEGAHAAAQIYSCYTFETCNRVFRDHETFSSSVYEGKFTARVGDSILNMGGDRHRRYRGLVSGRFTPKLMDWWVERWIEGTTLEMLDRVVGTGRAELTLDLCARLPLLTITGSFGMESDEALEVREIISGMMLDPSLSDEERGALRARFDEHLLAAVRHRRTDPADDLLTDLVQAKFVDDDGQHLLTDEEILAFSSLLLVAGSGTTWRQLGIMLYALLTHPDVLERVRADRSLIPAVLEETLRWETTDPYFPRLVTKDVDLDGVHLPAGSIIEVCMGAANRDSARWPDPETWDIDRKRLPHLAFATGPHSCMGMHLARTEMSVALNAVLDRLPNLRLDPDFERPYITGLEHRGPTALNVIFG